MLKKELIERQIQEIKNKNYLCIDCENIAPEGFTHCFKIKIKINEDGINFENWVRVCIPNDYPQTIPIVFDVDEVIPRNIDYHANWNGELCLDHPINLYEFFSKDKKLLAFIENFVVPFYYGFHYREKYGIYPFGEYSHGNKGTIEAIINYFDIRKEHIGYTQNIYNIFCNKKKLLFFMPKMEIERIEKVLIAASLNHLDLYEMVQNMEGKDDLIKQLTNHYTFKYPKLRLRDILAFKKNKILQTVISPCL